MSTTPGKIVSVTHTSLSAVSGRDEVTFEATKEQADELLAALAVIGRYEKAALRAVREKSRSDPGASDWCRCRCFVRKGNIHVRFDSGMAG